MSPLNVHKMLPDASSLPYSDGKPVDDENQNLIPNFLLLRLLKLWADRTDWFFGVRMGIHQTTGKDHKLPVVPNAFLSLGVERKKGGESRRSYATWVEGDVVPTFVLEMVSHQPGAEYDEKLDIYAKLGVLYYVVYNPVFWQRDGHQPFEVYKLTAGKYQQQVAEPYWMPEVGLGIGRYQGEVGGIRQEILTWYDAEGKRHLSVAEKEREKRERLESFLRSQGFDPDNLPN
ncbi:MAG: Uma2 family endonuclease [Cyanobacteria bacterium J06621_11]